MQKLPITARDYAELVEGLRARKAELGLSNQDMDRLSGYTDGYTDKVLGPSAVKGLSRGTIDTFMEVLAIDLVIVSSIEKAIRMEGRYEQRVASHVRGKGRVSKERIEEARPALEKVIRQEWSAMANARRSEVLPGKQRSEIARIGGHFKRISRTIKYLGKKKGSARTPAQSRQANTQP